MLEEGVASPLTAPLDSGLRRNDDGGGRPLLGRWVGLRCTGEGPHSPPPLWIPAFAGMTMVGAGMTKWGAGALLASDAQAASHSPPPLWIPAFAGMTGVGPA